MKYEKLNYLCSEIIQFSARSAYLLLVPQQIDQCFYWNRIGACIRKGPLIGIKVLTQQGRSLTKNNLRGALIGSRALNRIVTVVENIVFEALFAADRQEMEKKETSLGNMLEHGC